MADRLADPVRLRHAVGRIGAHNPERLDPPVLDRAKHVDGFESRLRCDRRRGPEGLDEAAVIRIVDFHMRGQHVGETTNFTTAHRVGLAGDGKRPLAGFANLPVAEGQLRIALTLSVPADDWLTPWL